MWIDSHCHLERFTREGELEVVLQQAEAARVERLITIGTGIDDWSVYYEMVKRYPRRLAWTVGIHPCDVGEGWEDDIKVIPSYFATDPLPVALGEIGLDYFHLPSFPDEAAEVKQRQQAAFRAQLELAYQFDCPLVIHSRNAFADCVEAIDRSGVDWNKVVFHCFVEGPGEMKILNEKGGRGSFTGIVTYKNKSVDSIREAVVAQGLDRIMIETDSPFLTPEPHRGKRNEPSYVPHVGECCAALLGVTVETLAQRATENTIRFFNLDG